MEVVSVRSALLSNYEVLTLLRELESEHLAQQKTAIRVKKEEEERIANGETQDPVSLNHLLLNEVCENLRTVEVEAIQYLAAEYQPIVSQTPQAVTQLVRNLGQYELTKAEKLQIVNLAPVEAVEIYTIIEEIEDRFGDRMDELLNAVRESLAAPPSGMEGTTGAHAVSESVAAEMLTSTAHETRQGWDEGGDVGFDDEYDDFGAGAGIEGDLEMNEAED